MEVGRLFTCCVVSFVLPSEGDAVVAVCDGERYSSVDYRFCLPIQPQVPSLTGEYFTYLGFWLNRLDPVVQDQRGGASFDPGAYGKYQFLRPIKGGMGRVVCHL